MKIIIQEFQESWAEDFLKLKDTIQDALKDLNVTIDHVGSTSVKGLGAKPVIDILIGLENEADLDKTIQPMQQNGFTYHKKFERVSTEWTAWPGRRLYTKLKSLSNLSAPEIIDFDNKIGPDFILQSNIHTVVKSTNDWKRMIAYKDFLRAHPKIRDEYYLIKKEISKQEFENMLKYNEAKNDFVKDVERQAIIWYENELAKKKNHITPQSLKVFTFLNFFF
ncbi:MAG: GrpB family protein [Bacteroidota bacterium]|nr:GrpB family protein [Bacteroidota bacterium]